MTVRTDRIIAKEAKKYGWILNRRPYRADSGDIAYSIRMTEGDIRSFGSESAKDIPTRNNRQHFIKKNSSMFLLCMAKRVPLKTYYKVGDRIAYSTDVNLGTKKWYNGSIGVEFGTIQKITEKMVQTTTGNVNKTYVLGKVKKDGF